MSINVLQRVECKILDQKCKFLHILSNASPEPLKYRKSLSLIQILRDLDILDMNIRKRGNYFRKKGKSSCYNRDVNVLQKQEHWSAWRGRGEACRRRRSRRDRGNKSVWGKGVRGVRSHWDEEKETEIGKQGQWYYS